LSAKKGNRPGKDEFEEVIARSMRIQNIYTLPNYAGYFDAEPASADIPFIWGGVGGFMEIKTGHDNALSFYTPKGAGGWGTHQIEWALERSRDKKNYVFLSVMYKVTHGNRLFVVPFPIAHATIQKIEAMQHTLPCVLTKDHALDIRNANLCAEAEWKEWEAQSYVYQSGKRKETLWQIAPILATGFKNYHKYPVK
jgi:hypothetical protein